MPSSLHEFRVIGLHPVIPSAMEFDEALELHWGAGLAGHRLDAARARVQEHFSRLFLIEIQIEPPSANLEWDQISQPIAGQPRSNRQAPYDERPIEESEGRWAFFMHFVDPEQPLSAPIGDRPLPPPTPTPIHLRAVKYEVP